MGKYGQAAVKAVYLIETSHSSTPQDAWEQATIEIFGEGTHGQKKGCPKNAFLGLCEEGLVRGIIPGTYTKSQKSQKNKEYAIRAVELLKQDPSLLHNKGALWKEVINGLNISHNAQLDVVISLWENNLIKD